MEKVSLYSKIGREKRIRFIDQRAKTVDYSKPVLYLHPTRPTVVAKEDAEILIKQDPHLVSYKPYKPKKKSDADNPDEPIEAPKPKEYREQDVLNVLEELANVDIEKMKMPEVHHFAKRLGLTIPVTLKLAEKKKLLLGYANELAEKVS